jgi:DNA-binding LacI/PurR family transcriptional regulator
VVRVIALRRQRLTGKHIAKITAVSAATVSRVLKRGVEPKTNGNAERFIQTALRE